MNLSCERCGDDFEGDVFVGYCPVCVEAFRDSQKAARRKANPAPGVHATGKFLATAECPRSVADPVAREPVCGICGGSDLEPGYGFAGGYGLGSYTFCLDCNTVLDFFEDSGE